MDASSQLNNWLIWYKNWNSVNKLSFFQTAIFFVFTFYKVLTTTVIFIFYEDNILISDPSNLYIFSRAAQLSVSAARSFYTKTSIWEKSVLESLLACVRKILKKETPKNTRATIFFTYNVKASKKWKQWQRWCLYHI